MTRPDLLAYADAIDSRLEAMHASAKEFIAHGYKPNWVMLAEPDVWGPPYPYDAASIWNRRIPLGSLGLAVSFTCGAMSVVVGLSLIKP